MSFLVTIIIVMFVVVLPTIFAFLILSLINEFVIFCKEKLAIKNHKKYIGNLFISKNGILILILSINPPKSKSDFWYVKILYDKKTYEFAFSKYLTFMSWLHNFQNSININSHWFHRDLFLV